MILTFEARSSDDGTTVVCHRVDAIALGYAFGTIAGFTLRALCGETTRVDEVALIGHESLEVTCPLCLGEKEAA